MSFLGIDIGTSYLKGAILDVDRRRFRHVTRIPFPEPIQGLNPLYYEHSPDAIARAVERLIVDLAEEAGSCEGVVMCSQMASTVLLDSDGRARSNCIGWRDQRALMEHPSGQGRYFDIVKQLITPEQRRSLGNEMPVGAPACFLFWASQQADPPANTTAVSLASYVVHRLCGSCAGEEPTNAMPFGLLDLTTMRWHKEVIGQLGLGGYQWPEIVPLGTVVGYYSLGGRSIPCYTPIGDYQCALLGALLEEGDLSINISTGSQVSRVMPNLELGDYQTRPFVDGQFTNTLTHLPAGRALNVLVDLLTELGRLSGMAVEDPWKWITLATESARGSDLEVRTTFFPGPAGESGALSNISERNLQVGTLFVAAFENMAENYWWAANRIWPDHSWEQVILTGGLANKLPALRKAIQKRFEGEMMLSQTTEETMCGLLLLAMKFSGQSSTLKDARNELRQEMGSLEQQLGTWPDIGS